MEEDLDFSEGESQADLLIQLDGAHASTTFAAYDSECRCVETCDLDIQGNAEDVLASLHELASFLKKFKAGHSFVATGDT